MFPSNTVDSGRASLSTTALKRLSEESLRTISPITAPKEVQSSTIIEEDEPSATKIGKEQLMLNLKNAQDAILANIDDVTAWDVLAMSTQFLTKIALTKTHK